jgi:tripartite-type tricarboxylate transporter receptor subunit TctC
MGPVCALLWLHLIFRFLSTLRERRVAAMRVLRLMLSVLALVAGAGAAMAQSTDATMRLVTPYAAGGVGDVLVRLIAAGLHQGLGRPVIVESKSGASGRLGVEYVKLGPADGSMLLFTPIAPMAVFPHSYAQLSYDPLRDFVPITQVAAFDMALAVGPQAPVQSLRELVEWLRQNPDKGSYGTPGAGTLPHLCAVLFGRSAGLELVQVAYKGNPPGIADLTGGHISMFFTSTPDLVQAHRDGRLRILATSGTKRSTVLPDVATFSEAGYDIHAAGWYGLYAPARTPRAIVEDINRRVVDVLHDEGVRKRLVALGLIPTGTTPEEFASIQADSSAFWGAAVRTAGFKADD